MDGFKDSTKMKYMGGGMVDGYAKGGMAKGEAKIGKVMGEFKKGELHSGSKEGPKVKSPKQAIAIAMSEARKAGMKAPMKKGSGGDVKMPSPAESAASGNRMAREEADEMRFMDMMEPKQNRQSMPMRSGKPPVYGVGKPAFPSSAASAASGNRVAKQEADEKKLMDALRGRDEGPRKPVTLKEKPVQVDLDEKRKKVSLNEKRVPVTLDEKRVRVDKMEYKTGGKVQTSSDTARKLATKMGGLAAMPKKGKC